METAREKLGLHVQCGSLGLEHNEVFLQQAQSAWLGDWAVGRGFIIGNNFVTQFRKDASSLAELQNSAVRFLSI